MHPLRRRRDTWCTLCAADGPIGKDHHQFGMVRGLLMLDLMARYEGFLAEATLVDDAGLRDECCCWSVTPDVYPRRGDPSAKLGALVRWAVLAPSGHNAQPWGFRIADGRLELRADRSRALPVVDPDDRELTISCGAALQHLRLAVGRFGSAPDIRILPVGDDPDLLATVAFGAERQPLVHEVALFDAISKRRTHRGPYEPTPLPATLLDTLGADVESQGAHVRFFVDAASKAAIADLVAEGDRIQMSDKRFRRELAAWMRSNTSHARDGLPGYALRLRDLASLVGPLVVRTFDLGAGQAAKDRELAEHSPVLAVISTDRDDEASWLAAGEAVARLLLRARGANVWGSFLSQPTEVPELRRPLAELAGGGFPQLVLRLGRAAHVPPPTPRRSADEVLHRA